MCDYKDWRGWHRNDMSHLGTADPWQHTALSRSFYQKQILKKVHVTKPSSSQAGEQKEAEQQFAFRERGKPEQCPKFCGNPIPGRQWDRWEEGFRKFLKGCITWARQGVQSSGPAENRGLSHQTRSMTQTERRACSLQEVFELYKGKHQKPASQ